LGGPGVGVARRPGTGVGCATLVLMSEPVLTLTTVNIGAPDPSALARFYQRLLGWQVTTDEADWVVLTDPAGGVSLAFQTEASYVRPSWPAGAGEQQMMMHLEIQVDDLAAASDHAVACGATLADWQPQDDVRVHLDPVGHPFCLYLD
jgi:catechol 2,3-dioxygenase-like lactoylglutathione lyase family enzyme